ncbi:S1 RNA-binding domain-containing protein [Nocardiopsis sp. NPDC050513]|uniref:S1 RNA-binding domain-containing protein n=1 Tax=Nocardiopsis sp. NPDC050513 TaxID=3364338 RepID=UPI0037A14881
MTSLRPGEVLSGVVAGVQRFGVFVALDDGPPHPVLPGVGFVRIPELSWETFTDPTEIAEVGQPVSGAFLQASLHNGEAVLSLKALVPDPFQDFADAVREGATVSGPVTKLVPFGAFVRVADGVEGLIPLGELAREPVDAPERAIREGERVTAVVTRVERDRRRLHLSRRRAAPGPDRG